MFFSQYLVLLAGYSQAKMVTKRITRRSRALAVCNPFVNDARDKKTDCRKQHEIEARTIVYALVETSNSVLYPFCCSDESALTLGGAHLYEKSYG